MPRIDEIAPDLFRVSVYHPQLEMSFNHFVVRDQDPLLFHTGYRGMFPTLREEVGKLIDLSKLRWIGWSHFESDECGALNDWLGVAPHAEPVCTFVGKVVNVDDFASRPARGMTSDETLSTGRHRFRFISSPHLPHGWDAGVMLEETRGTLLCSDLFHHFGDGAAMTDRDILGRVRDAVKKMQAGPLAAYMPYTCHTEPLLRGLADLKPRTLAVMHGSSYTGDASKALRDLAGLLQEEFHASAR
jgi:flavorubredoxin